MTNVEKEIAFPLENMGIPRKEMKERVNRALELVHLEAYRSRHPYYLYSRFSRACRADDC